MLNTKSVEVVENSSFRGKWRAPAFGSYCFAAIPPAISKILTGSADTAFLPCDAWQPAAGAQKLILILVDGFGWSFFERWKDEFPLLQRLCREAAVSKLTAQFPSTTVAEINTLQSGLLPAQSGVFEWFYYEPEVDGVIAPFLFSRAGDDKPDTLLTCGIEPERIFPQTSVYQALAGRGVASTVFLHEHYALSPYSRVASRGAATIPFRNIEEGLAALAARVQAAPGRNFFYFYIDAFDGAAHGHGPDSAACHDTARHIFSAIESFLDTGLAGGQSDTAVIITADHGETAVEPENALYVNLLMPELTGYLRCNKRGDRLLFGGAPRDLFLYVQDESLGHVKSLLQKKLEGAADLYTLDELIAAGIFGPHPVSERFKARAGNLVILPHEHEQVSWFEEGRFKCHLKGHHGGLTAEEMEIPFAVLRL